MLGSEKNGDGGGGGEGQITRSAILDRAYPLFFPFNLKMPLSSDFSIFDLWFVTFFGGFTIFDIR